MWFSIHVSSVCSPRLHYSSVTKDNVQIVQWWKVFGLSSLYISWRWTKTNHASIPSLKITWVSWLNRAQAVSPLYERLNGNQRASLPAACTVQMKTKSWWLLRATVPKADSTEVGTTQQKHWDLSCTACGIGALEKIGGILSPSWFGVGLMPPYTLAAVEKVNQKIYLITFLFPIKCSHTHKIHTLWIWGGSFSSNF